MSIQGPEILEEHTPRALRILVADDEPMIVHALDRILTLRGHEVSTTADAREALVLARSNDFDAAIIDVGMPGGGLKVVQQLDSDPDFHGLVVLMTGGLATDPLMQAGPDVIRLQKPFRLSELVPLVEDGTRF